MVIPFSWHPTVYSIPPVYLISSLSMYNHGSRVEDMCRSCQNINTFYSYYCLVKTLVHFILIIILLNIAKLSLQNKEIIQMVV